MNWEILIAGFALGAAGSLHCAGMCGPLVMALPVQHFSKQRRLAAILLNQTGRVTTYSLLGLLLGLAGRRIYLAGLQQGFSILTGALIVILVLSYRFSKRPRRPGLFSVFYNLIQTTIIRLLRSDRMINYYMLGVANGLLPCGMVYMAIAGSLTADTVAHSVLFMAGFGIGTLPAMVSVTYFGQFFKLSIRNQFKKALPVIAALMGVLLILRGLNLGIPFISPVIRTTQGGLINCH